MNFDTALEIQKISTGEPRRLTRGQIADEMIEFDKMTRGFKPELTEMCRDFFNELKNDDTAKVYDADALLEEAESLRKQFTDFISDNKDSDVFRMIYDDIVGFFQNPPFEGLDSIEYGIHEVCVFSVAEYVTSKFIPGYDHEHCRMEYRDSIEERTSEGVGDRWIKVYDDLQRRYEEMPGDPADDDSFRIKLTACCIIAVSAIKDQDGFSLDMVQSGAEAKAKAIVDAQTEGDHKEGGSDLIDNAVKLFDFVYRYVRRANGK